MTMCAMSMIAPTPAPTNCRLPRPQTRSGWPALPLLVLLLALAACSQPSSHRKLPPSTAAAPTLAGPASTLPPSGTLGASATVAAAAPVRASPPPAAPSSPASAPIPAADPFDLARRLLHIDAPRTVNSQPPQYRAGDPPTSFWLEDSATDRSYTILASLRYVSEHAYLYVQDGLRVSDAEIVRAGQDFDRVTYPLVTADVGLPAFPGIDNDPRITILVADLHGAGGYFTQIDNEPQVIEPTSNQRKMIYIDLTSARPGTTTFDGYVAHEFQHLVHYHRSHASQAWINEGMSEVFREQITHDLLNIPKYEDTPDTQLNDWPTLGEGSALPHYGAAHSFLRYLLQHYGGIEQAGTLAAEPGDGIAEVRAYLAQGGYGISFEDVFADWLVANLINSPVGGRFSQNDPAIGVHAIQTLSAPANESGSVHQFGARYYSLPSGSAVHVDFQGDPSVTALPAAPHGSRGIWWSRRGDAIDSTLTRALDLSGVTRATLHFDTWYDIERDYDFGYLEVSSDSGATWTTLRGQHATDENPFGIALGPAYTGASGGGDTPRWIEETADLSPFAGQRLLLRFEYVTDESANRNGWAIDTIRVPEIGYSDAAEAKSGDWTAAGFERLTGPLPQRFIVQAVLIDAGGVSVQRLSLDESNHASIDTPPGLRRVYLIVSGATDLIRTPAGYQFSVRPEPTE